MGKGRERDTEVCQKRCSQGEKRWKRIDDNNAVEDVVYVASTHMYIHTMWCLWYPLVHPLFTSL